MINPSLNNSVNVTWYDCNMVCAVSLLYDCNIICAVSLLYDCNMVCTASLDVPHISLSSVSVALFLGQG